MHITSLKEAEKILLKYVPAVREFTGKNVTLGRIQPLLKVLDNPQEKCRVIHIAGTSGKTSTSYYIAALLQASGVKVGLTVSPHIDKVTERIQLNGLPISDELFCKYLGECIELIKDLPVQPSYFELLMALAYWIFFKEGMDYAVIETGMGGLHDGSNVVSRPDKVCVITDIGFDHMHILGNTISEIAFQKAGIIQNGNTIFMYKQSHDVIHEVRVRSEGRKVDLHVLNDTVPGFGAELKLQFLPDFQRRNFLLAREVVTYVAVQDKVVPPTIVATIKAAHTYVPGRMDVTKVGDKLVIMDGAHNGQKVGVFVNSFIHKYADLKVPILLALKEGKEFTDVVTELSKIASYFILTSFATTQDLPSHAMSPQKLGDYIHALPNSVPYSVISNSHKAFEALLARPEDTCLLIGSFYMLGQVRRSEQLQHSY